MKDAIRGWKLLRVRSNGSLGPLFINRQQVIPIGTWLNAEDHPTKGFAHRPGWHAAPKAFAPHLLPKGRVWCRVELADYTLIKRPASQGCSWYLANRMKIIRVAKGK